MRSSALISTAEMKSYQIFIDRSFMNYDKLFIAIFCVNYEEELFFLFK